MKVLIIEDENLAAEKLKKQILQIDAGIEILAMLESVDESVNWLANHPAPDLIFMDIQLDDGISFEIFDSVTIKSPIIFTTAFDQYAIKAFKVNGIDYLLKPISYEDLSAAFAKYRNLFIDKDLQQDRINQLYSQLVKSYKTRFMVKIGNHYHSVSSQDIVCFFIQERSTFIKTIVGKNFTLDYSLDQVQKIIDPEVFYRINRNYIININSISDIISYSSSRLLVKLKNFEHLEDLLVSRDRTADFKSWLDR